MQNDNNDGNKSVVYELAREGDSILIDSDLRTTTDSQLIFNTTNLTAGKYIITVRAIGVQDNNTINTDVCEEKSDQATFEIFPPNAVCEPTVVAPTTIVSQENDRFTITCE